MSSSSSRSRSRSGHGGDGSWPPAEKMSASSDEMLLEKGSSNSWCSMPRVASLLAAVMLLLFVEISGVRREET